MGQVTFKLEAEEAKAVKAFMRVVDAQKKTERGAKKAGAAGRQAGAATEKGAKGAAGAFDNMGKSAVSSFKSMATGLIGAGGVLAAVQMVRAELEATAAAQRDLANKAMPLDKAAQAVATQFGMGSTDAGQAKGAAALQKIVRAGKFGEDIDIAQEIAITAHSAYGEKDKALSGESLKIAETTARFAGYTQMNAELAGSYIKVLKQSGAVTQEDVLKTSAQMHEAFTLSLSSNVGDFMGGIVRFMAGHKARGGTVERGLARYSQAVEVTGSEYKAAQMFRKVTDIVTDKEVAAKLAAIAWPEMAAVDDAPKGLLSPVAEKKRRQRKMAGNKEAMVKRFMDLPMDVREKMLGEFAEGASDFELKEMGLEGPQIGVIKAMYGREGLKGIAERETKMNKVKSAAVLSKLDKYDKTAYVNRQKIATDTVLLPAQTSEATKLGDVLLKNAAERNKLMREGGLEDTLHGVERFLFKPEREDYTIALRSLWKQTRGLKGKIPEYQRLQVSQEIYDEMHGKERWSMNPRDVGELALKVEGLKNPRPEILTGVLGDNGMLEITVGLTDSIRQLNETIKENSSKTEANTAVGNQQPNLTPGAITGDIHGE